MKAALFVIFWTVSLHAQPFRPPDWLVGGWETLTQNNSREIEFINISKEGSIVFSKGIPPTKEFSLDSLYIGWSVQANENDTLFAVKFIHNKDTVVYVFYKLDKIAWADGPAMTYTLHMNGILMHPYSDSMPGIFLRPRSGAATR